MIESEPTKTSLKVYFLGVAFLNAGVTPGTMNHHVPLKKTPSMYWIESILKDPVVMTVGMIFKKGKSVVKFVGNKFKFRVGSNLVQTSFDIDVKSRAALVLLPALKLTVPSQDVFLIISAVCKYGNPRLKPDRACCKVCFPLISNDTGMTAGRQ